MIKCFVFLLAKGWMKNYSKCWGQMTEPELSTIKFCKAPSACLQTGVGRE